MADDTRRNPSERSADDTSRQHVGWREILTRAYLPQLLTLCLAIWLHAANSMLAATTLPEAVADIGGLRLISWAFALYLMGSIVAATAISACVASHGLRRTMMASTLVYTGSAPGRCHDGKAPGMAATGSHSGRRDLFL